MISAAWVKGELLINYNESAGIAKAFDATIFWQKPRSIGFPVSPTAGGLQSDSASRGYSSITP